MALKESKAWLVLETGTIYEGVSIGVSGESFGEVVFNTGTTGYNEILTDPSYHGQIVVMTQPHIGNYGVQPEDFESARIHAAGLIVQECTPHAHHAKSRRDLAQWLKKEGVCGISGMPTREITLCLREKGSLRGMITTRRATAKAWLAKVKKSPKMSGRALAGEVTTGKPYLWKSDVWEGGHRVAVLDFGVKRSILNVLSEAGCAVRVFPADTSAETLLGEHPDAVVLSNGPGDPAADRGLIATAKKLLRSDIPLMGICLGHQILGLAAGAKSYKLRFGHHGVNHPVKDVQSGKILVTSQNHGFALKPNSLPKDFEATHMSLNDATLEGFRHKRRPVCAYQFHPEAGPGPTESRELIRNFLKII